MSIVDRRLSVSLKTGDSGDSGDAGAGIERFLSQTLQQFEMILNHLARRRSHKIENSSLEQLTILKPGTLCSVS